MSLKLLDDKIYFIFLWLQALENIYIWCCHANKETMKELLKKFSTNNPDTSSSYFEKNEKLSCQTLDSSGMSISFIIHHHQVKVHVKKNRQEEEDNIKGKLKQVNSHWFDWKPQFF